MGLTCPASISSCTDGHQKPPSDAIHSRQPIEAPITKPERTKHIVLTSSCPLPASATGDQPDRNFPDALNGSKACAAHRQNYRNKKCAAAATAGFRIVD